MFTRTLEYALRAVAHLAMKNPGAVTAAELATATQVPAPYLSKVLQQLRHHDLVVSRRGVGGGVRLARPPELITILDIANAVEPIKPIAVCPLGLAGHGARLCALHHRMDSALEQIEAAFAASTLAEVVEQRDGVIPLCPFPADKVSRASSKGAPTG